MKLFTFEEYFGTTNKSDLLKKSATFIRKLRDDMKLTGTQFQEMLKTQGATKAIDAPKQCKWEKGRVLPNPVVQDRLIKIQNDRSFDKVHSADYGFDLPPVAGAIRSVVQSELYDEALVFIQREKEIGVLSKLSLIHI